MYFKSIILPLQSLIPPLLSLYIVSSWTFYFSFIMCPSSIPSSGSFLSYHDCISYLFSNCSSQSLQNNLTTHTADMTPYSDSLCHRISCASLSRAFKTLLSLPLLCPPSALLPLTLYSLRNNIFFLPLFCTLCEHDHHISLVSFFSWLPQYWNYTPGPVTS